MLLQRFHSGENCFAITNVFEIIILKFADTVKTVYNDHPCIAAKNIVAVVDKWP